MQKPYASKRGPRSTVVLSAVAFCMCAVASWIGYSISMVNQSSTASGVRLNPSSSNPAHIPDMTPRSKPVKRSSKVQPQQLQASVCTDNCSKAKDGKCDDGSQLLKAKGSHDKVQVYCDPGTDCSDCGPWKGPGPSSSWSDSKPPIEFILSRGVRVYLKRSHTAPSFLMPFTDADKDVDVSSGVEHGGIVEGGISKIFMTILEGRCTPGAPSSSALFMDVGANFGWFTYLAASLGCRVIAWEPVPTFRAFLEYGLQMNGFQPQVEVRTAVVGGVAGQKLQLVVPNRGIWGTAGVDGMNIDHAIKNDGALEEIHVKSETLDGVVDEPVELLKVDVEGYEPYVMDGAVKTMAQHVQNLVMEYSPGVRERVSNWTELIRFPQMLQHLLATGFQVGHISDSMARNGQAYNQPLPPFPQVTAEALQYDVLDGQKLHNRTLGCDPDLFNRLPEKHKFLFCNSIPEALHPYSFHSVFGHSTNIWATRNATIQAKGPQVGIFPVWHPLKTWTIPKDQKFGVGGGWCGHFQGLSKVTHRCPCDDPPTCREAEEIANKLAAEGKLPFDQL